jgi:hypothetical protein
MALAIYFDDLIRLGEVKSYAELAAIGHVSRSRLSQIMALNDLCPKIQEDLLGLPPVTAGGDPVSERQLRPIAATIDWTAQRNLWDNRNP